MKSEWDKRGEKRGSFLPSRSRKKWRKVWLWSWLTMLVMTRSSRRNFSSRTYSQCYGSRKKCINREREKVSSRETEKRDWRETLRKEKVYQETSRFMTVYFDAFAEWWGDEDQKDAGEKIERRKKSKGNDASLWDLIYEDWIIFSITLCIYMIYNIIIWQEMKRKRRELFISFSFSLFLKSKEFSFSKRTESKRDWIWRTGCKVKAFILRMFFLILRIFWIMNVGWEGKWCDYYYPIICYPSCFSHGSDFSSFPYHFHFLIIFPSLLSLSQKCSDHFFYE